MKRWNSLSFFFVLGAVTLVFGWGRQVSALSINDINKGQLGNGQIQPVNPTGPAINHPVEMAKPSSAKPNGGKIALPPGEVKVNPPPAATPIPLPSPDVNSAPSGSSPKHPGYPSFDFGHQSPLSACGHYETVLETVLIEAERIEQFWVQPEYRTVVDPSGQTHLVKVKGGYLAERLIPARYAIVPKQVWVQDAPSVGFGLEFKF